MMANSASKKGYFLESEEDFRNDYSGTNVFQFVYIGSILPLRLIISF